MPRIARRDTRHAAHRLPARRPFARLAALVRNAEDAIVGLTPQGRISLWNRGAEHLYGYPARHVLGQPLERLVPEDRRDEGAWLMSRMRQGHAVRSLETRRLHHSGRVMEVAITASPLRDARGRLEGVLEISRDITVEHQLMLEARQLQSYLEGVLAHFDTAVLLTGTSGRIVYANPAFTRYSGLPVEQVVGRGRKELLEATAGRLAQPEPLRERLHAPLATHEIELRGRPPERRVWRWRSREIGLPQGPGRLDVFRDVTEEVELRERLAQSATTDPLTGLLNRRGATHVLEREAAHARRHATPLSVAMIDVDRFKHLNDREGHAAGDRALREIAESLSTSLRAGDALCRWGGEELLVVLPATRLAEALALAERLRRSVETLPGPRGIPLTISVGVATWTPEDAAVEAVIARADARLYVAKRSGRNRVA